jgi:hypothetical protein
MGSWSAIAPMLRRFRQAARQRSEKGFSGALLFPMRQRRYLAELPSIEIYKALDLMEFPENGQ